MSKIRVGICPECGSPTRVARNGDWRCLAFEQKDPPKGVKVVVCGARGTTVNGKAAVLRGSNNVWRTLEL